MDVDGMPLVTLFYLQEGTWLGMFASCPLPHHTVTLDSSLPNW